MNSVNLTHLGLKNVFADNTAIRKDILVNREHLKEKPIYHFFDVYTSPIINCSNDDSFDRMRQLSVKHIRNIKDPNEIYKQPVATSQDIGFWLRDKDMIDQQGWALQRETAPVFRSDVLRTWEDIRKADHRFENF